MKDASRRVQVAYDQIAEAYACRWHSCMPDSLVDLARELLLRTGRGARIVEVGCGTGRDMAWLESQGARVTGIDLSSGMLAYARQHVRGALLLMDMRSLAFRSAQFDGAWCCAALLHLPKSEAPGALREVRRVLKPGGTLVLSVQIGRGECWEGGYVQGAKRLFARYAADEMEAMLGNSWFIVRESYTVWAETREWLSLVCVAA